MTLPGRWASALLAAAGLLAGCSTPTPPAETLIDTASGRSISRAELLQALRGADVVLLGELHDNPRHHALRAELLLALGARPADGRPPPAVVAEHLDRGRRVNFGVDLLASLQGAGFDASGWEWPLHEPLFAAVARAGLPLSGGNAPRDLVRRVAREGLAAAPADLRPLLDAAPLAPAAQAALDQDLVDGHCGRLPAARLPGMRAAQRVRDASMWLALREAGTRPAVLLAGNGHVRRDYGVPQIAAALQPQARVLSVGFAEFGTATAPATYHYVWTTARTQREDPCASVPPMAPAPAAPASADRRAEPAARTCTRVLISIKRSAAAGPRVDGEAPPPVAPGAGSWPHAAPSILVASCGQLRSPGPPWRWRSGWGSTCSTAPRATRR